MKTQIRCFGHMHHASLSGRSGDPHLLNLDTIVHLSLTLSSVPVSSLLLSYHRSCFLCLPPRGLCLFASHPSLPSSPLHPFRAFSSRVTCVSGLTEIFCTCPIWSCGSIGGWCWPGWRTVIPGNPTPEEEAVLSGARRQTVLMLLPSSYNVSNFKH